MSLSVKNRSIQIYLHYRHYSCLYIKNDHLHFVVILISIIFSDRQDIFAFYLIILKFL